MNKIDFSKVKALLLDLDGTLINSEKAFCDTFIDVFKNQYNISVTVDEYKRLELEQNTMLIKLKKIENPSIRDKSDKEIMNNVYELYYDYFKKVIREDEAVDNFRLIKELKKLKLRLALVTTCRRFYLEELIKANELEGVFDYIVARDDVKPEELKPDPTAYFMTLDELDINPYECLAIEDSKRGIDAALKANIPTIKVENFTTIKFKDDRVDEYNSANEVLRKILIYKENE